MVVIPAGEFIMGSPLTEVGRTAAEGPQHKVTIARPFAASKFDITFAEWDACVSMGACARWHDSGMGRGTRPVVYVDWDDAQRYTAWLNRMIGKSGKNEGYRLLSEAEWEYVARADTTTAYSWGNEIGQRNANCNGCGSNWEGTSPVGSFKPNAFGLYDMHGNLWQWVEDCWHESYKGAPTDGSAWISGECSQRVVRGGSWLDSPQLIRSAMRTSVSDDFRKSIIGFRVERTLNTTVRPNTEAGW